jgi:hypothetical protein
MARIENSHSIRGIHFIRAIRVLSSYHQSKTYKVLLPMGHYVSS